MRRIAALIPAALMCVTLTGVEGKAEGPAVTKEEVIARAWRAMFGERQDRDIRDLAVEGYFHGGTIPSRMTLKRPNLFRNEVESGVLVFDGRRAAWVTRTPDATGTPRGPELIEPRYWRHFEVDIALLFPAFFDYPSQLRGVEMVNGSEAYAIFVALPLGGSVTYFVDAESFLVTRRLVSWDGGDDSPLWENLVDGWLDVEGIRFPDGYVFEGREGREKGFYKKVRFNLEPASALFEIPADLR
ncbi:MAG: hypothetical protein R6W79_11505 [Acidimicrobiia bacterium]